MTTTEIEGQANRGSIATADMDLKFILRREIVPQFLEDVGECNWRRRFSTITTEAGTQEYDMPADFSKAKRLIIPETSTAGESELTFIGEDPKRVAAAETMTEQQKPCAFYVVQDDSNHWKRIKFQAPCDGVYTIVATYYMYCNFSDNTTAVDMSIYIPEQFHWGLVEGLRRSIMEDRFGQGDKRYQVADRKYQEWVARADAQRELASRTYGVYVR